MARHVSSVLVKAPPAAIFTLLERDRTEFHDDELTQFERLGDVPFGPGYAFTEKVVHGAAQPCEGTTTVTLYEPGRILVEEWDAVCRVSNTTMTGTNRYEVTVGRAGTVLVGELVRKRPGLDGVMDWLSGAFRNPMIRKLTYLKMRAEALARTTA